MPTHDKFLKLTAKVKDCACCGAYVSATEWKEFMCHNLGADQGLDPHDMSQPNAWGLNGAYIQWGKNHDMWATTNDGPGGFAAAPTASNPNGGTIPSWNQATLPQSAWDDLANQPCPAGYRVPTKAEWGGVLANNAISRSGSWSSNVTNYGSAIHFGPSAGVKLLTLPASGFRTSTNGALNRRGRTGRYWSATFDSSGGNYAYYLSFRISEQKATYTNHRRNALSIRCIKN